MNIKPESEKDGRLETKPANPEGRTVKCGVVTLKGKTTNKFQKRARNSPLVNGTKAMHP